MKFVLHVEVPNERVTADEIESLLQSLIYSQRLTRYVDCRREFVEPDTGTLVLGGKVVGFWEVTE